MRLAYAMACIGASLLKLEQGLAMMPYRKHFESKALMRAAQQFAKGVFDDLEKEIECNERLNGK